MMARHVRWRNRSRSLWKLRSSPREERSSPQLRRLRLESLEHRWLLTAMVKHPPYLQLGDAELGAPTDQVEIIWQTIGDAEPGEFTVEYRLYEEPASAYTAVDVTMNPEIRTGLDESGDPTGVPALERVNRSAVIAGLDYLTVADAATGHPRYTYRVLHNGGTPDRYENSFDTRFARGDAAPFTFAAYGDSATWGDAGAQQRFRGVVGAINSLDSISRSGDDASGTAFSLLLGDAEQNEGTHQQQDARFDTRNPEPDLEEPGQDPLSREACAGVGAYISSHVEYFTFGNRDMLTGSENGGPAPAGAAGSRICGQASRDNFSSPLNGPSSENALWPEHNYSFDYGNVHFATFDSNSTGFLEDAGRPEELELTGLAARQQRLRGQLDWLVEDMQASDAQWKIVYAHHDLEDEDNDQFGPALVEALNEAGVDLYLHGHVHRYRSSYPLQVVVGRVDEIEPDEHAGVKSNQYLKGVGVVRVQSGVGGKTARESGYLRIDVTSDTLRVQQIRIGDEDCYSPLMIVASADVEALPWPDGWETMEIEAKWTTAEATLEKIKEDFLEQDDRPFAFEGITRNYDTPVRWGGLPRRFTDVYYDSPTHDLADDLHSLRQRTCEKHDGNDPQPDFDDDLSSLLDLGKWQRNWERVQYKSTPTRFGAVWFRRETGDAKLTADQVTDTFNGDTLEDHLGDDPVAHAEADHRGLVWLDDTPTANRVDDFMRIVDFRYRIRFREPGTKTDRYELSLDKVQQWTKDAQGAYTIGETFFEVELEAIIDNKDNPQVHTEAETNELFRLVRWFENEYPTLEPSTTSKGGNKVADMGVHESQEVPLAVSRVGSTVTVYGTAGDDTFELTVGDSTYTAVINGDVQPFAADEIDSVVFDGGAGYDTAEVRGSSRDEIVTMSPASTSFSVEGLEVTVSHAAKISVSGGGGNDVVFLQDSSGNDKFVGTPVYAALDGDGFYNQAWGFGEVQARATDGIDIAKLFDSVGNDLFVTTPIYGGLSGDGFDTEVWHFDGVHAYSTTGGIDVAKHFDSVDDDSFYGDSEHGAVYRPGQYYNRAKHFETVHAYATAGGYDQAELHGSAGDDLFYSDDIHGASWSDEFYNRAKFFEKVAGYAGEGGNDQAELHDSAFADHLEANEDWARLSNEAVDFLYEVIGFHSVKARSTTPDDTRSFTGLSQLDFLLELEGPWQDPQL